MSNISLEKSGLLDLNEFQKNLRQRLQADNRLVTCFGSPGLEANSVILNVILASTQNQNSMSLFQCWINQIKNDYPSLTVEFPQFHCFEREIFEQYRIKPVGHPWLKPIRYPSSSSLKMGDYPFYDLSGKEIHEVGVGPIHAGVIEPGHFRFMCYGEKVHHLEIQLGYQHRGVEELLLKKNPSQLAPMIESIAGDSAVAHTWAYCKAWEALCGVEMPFHIELVRGIALELERVAMHLAGLAGISTDIAFLLGAATYGRLRTTAINTSMRLCGSRFGRGWLRPGEVRFRWNSEMKKDVQSALDLLQRDLQPINDLFQTSRTVQHRLKEVGSVSTEITRQMGFVGMAARSAGVSIDLRHQYPGQLYEKIPLETVTEPSGDCWARAVLRIREIDASLKWLKKALELLGDVSKDSTTSWKIPLNKPKSSSLSVGLIEGWRGEVMHCLQTDSQGNLSHYKVQDPSLRHWFALALAVRGNEISDFPICNKSFDLSYCGQDL